MRRIILLVALAAFLNSCSLGSSYRAYAGEALSAMQVSVLEGASFLRQDLINRYIDAVKFSRVDDIQIENSIEHSAIEITPGYHDITVYFYWDLGSQRGLAPALVNYASSRETLSRTLRFNARAGESYEVRAQPVFTEGRRDITTLAHVDFWVVDQSGNEVVTREQGRYNPSLGSNP